MLQRGEFLKISHYIMSIRGGAGSHITREIVIVRDGTKNYCKNLICKVSNLAL